MKGIVAAGASVMPSSLVSEPAQGCSFCCIYTYYFLFMSFQHLKSLEIDQFLFYMYVYRSLFLVRLADQTHTSGAVCLIAEDTILVMYCISN